MNNLKTAKELLKLAKSIISGSGLFNYPNINADKELFQQMKRVENAFIRLRLSLAEFEHGEVGTKEFVEENIIELNIEMDKMVNDIGSVQRRMQGLSELLTKRERAKTQDRKMTEQDYKKYLMTV